MMKFGTKAYKMERGLREGCPSSPPLFNCYHTAVMIDFEKTNLKVQMITKQSSIVYQSIFSVLLAARISNMSTTNKYVCMVTKN